MPTDLLTNLVAFELNHNGKLDRVVGHGQTKASDCIQTAWLEVEQKHGAKEQEVRRIYSDWAMSVEDQQFVATHFPGAELTYSFSRPADGNWEVALEDARQSIEKAMAKHALDAANTMEGRVPVPVVRDIDGLSVALVHSLLTPELGLFLAYVGTTERGTSGVQYVTSAMLKEQKLKLKKLWEQALTNLKQGLSVNVVHADGQQCFVMERRGGFAAAAIGLPDFAKQAVSWVGNRRLLVGLPNPDTLMVCAASSLLVRRIEDAVMESDYQGAVNLTPCVLLLHDGKMTLHLKRQGR